MENNINYENLTLSSNNESFVKYKVTGLTGLTLSKNFKFQTNNEYVKNIFLDDNLEYLRIELNDNISYIEYSNEIDLFAKGVLFNLIINTSAEFSTPVIFIDTLKESDSLTLFDNIGFTEKITMHRTEDANKIYTTISNVSKDLNSLYYNKIFEILQNQNLIVQFENLYQMALDLTKKPKDIRSYQKNLTDYLKKHKDRYPFISFFMSIDKNGKEIQVDSITFLRNQISHSKKISYLNTYSHLGSQINCFTIKNLLKIITDILNDKKFKTN